MQEFLFFLVVVLSISNNIFFDYKDQSEFKFIAPIFLIFGYFVGSFIFKKQIQLINKEDDLQIKLHKYMSATIVRAVLLETAAIIGVVGTFITANSYYLIFTGIALVFMLVNFPTKDKFSQILNLDFEEKVRLSDL